NLHQHVSVPYYQALLSLHEVVYDLKPLEALPSEIRSKWNLEEAFERNINRKRVDEVLVAGYFHRPEKLKFFNSITVALLPLNEQGMLAHSYGETPRQPDLREALKKEPWKVVNAGGVQIITNEKSPNGYIRWDPKRIFPATIDGQHRLAA